MDTGITMGHSRGIILLPDPSREKREYVTWGLYIGYICICTYMITYIFICIYSCVVYVGGYIYKSGGFPLFPTKNHSDYVYTYM